MGEIKEGHRVKETIQFPFFELLKKEFSGLLKKTDRTERKG